MTRPEGDTNRLQRVRRLRSDWRRHEEGQHESDDLPAADDGVRGDALSANDRIRAEAPDDLETRRRADQLEREVRNVKGRRT